ncbi:hypothetical protein LTR56_018828 [Elasticomyces elasticus]|nr:hypothetical protein LTR22_026990 [Elasticomyces elasticus]KAK3628091.1 hypothetical protein LTR56_018828 [Elasticomyces elasticus]KAK4907033.1 hypothetical protein LTR49_023886 [Elasticomyces elasticus]KAK5735037.1 hypothetical protein LTS12_026561 [Elasticomyces elasticus]
MNMGSTATLDLDNTNDSNPSPVSYIEPLAPNVHHTPTDNYHSSMASTLKSHCEALEFESHVSVLLSQTRKLTDRNQVVLDALNSTYEVRRLTVEESGPLDFKTQVKELVRVQYPAKAAQTLYEAVVLESGMLLNKTRSLVAGISMQAVQMTREEQELVLPDVEDQCCFDQFHVDECKVNVVYYYREMLRSWNQVFAETKTSVRDLEKRYDTRSNL